MEIAALIVGIVAVLVAVGTLIDSRRTAKKTEKLQRQLAKEQEEFARWQQREQLLIEIIHQLRSLLSAQYNALWIAANNEDWERFEDAWVSIETLLATKLELENIQANRQYSGQLESFYRMNSTRCLNASEFVKDFQSTALVYKNHTLATQIIVPRRDWVSKTQSEKSRLEQQEAMRIAYRGAMRALGKVMTAWLNEKQLRRK